MAAEDFIIEVFAMSQLCTEHGKRVTLMDRDVTLVLRIRNLVMLQ